jgi:hypothetical protein
MKQAKRFRKVRSTLPSEPRALLPESAAGPFAQKNLSILLDTHTLREQARAGISPFEARLPHPSPNAVS